MARLRLKHMSCINGLHAMLRKPRYHTVVNVLIGCTQNLHCYQKLPESLLLDSWARFPAATSVLDFLDGGPSPPAPILRFPGDPFLQKYA